eukprot:478600-Pelagomonas_calceolata.AAC.8
MTLALRHPIYSAILNTEVATFMFLPACDWKSWAYTDGSCQVQDGKTVIGAGVHHPMRDSTNLVELNGAGITKTIGRAELAAIAAALTHSLIRSRTHTHTLCHRQPQLTSPTQKVKSHAGIAGNECADEVAKYQAKLKDNNLTDTGIPSAGRNPFYNIAWLAQGEARPSTPESSSPIFNLVYFPE